MNNNLLIKSSLIGLVLSSVFVIFGRTIVVTNNADFGVQTLRAVLNNQARPGDIITFNISPATITLTTSTLRVPVGLSGLPITIDGTSQPGIQIIVSPSTAFDALTLSSFNIVKGLTINGGRTAITAGANNQITGCFLGTNTTGTAPLPNGAGISLIGNSNTVSNCTISGNTGAGISIQSGSSMNTISNNTIGASSTGTSLGNTGFGIHVLGPTNTFMGNNVSFQTQTQGIVVTSDGNTFTGNTINSNSIAGMLISGSHNTLSSNTFENNLGPGLVINSTGSGNSIGSSAQTGNIFSGNKGAGVVIGTSLVDNAVANTLLFNSIFNNTLLGIDLGNLGVPLPPQTNPSPGPNHLQNAPILTSSAQAKPRPLRVLRSAQLMCNGDLTVTFSLQSVPLTSFLIQFFKNPINRNGLTPAITEGQTPIGTTTVMTNAAGTVSTSITFTPTNTVLPTDFISATATNQGTVNGGDTSEFSFNVAITAPTTPAVTITTNSPSFSICTGSSITLTATVTNESGPFTYLWSTGDTTESITVTPTATTTYTVGVTDSSGCKGNGSQQVTVNPNPTVTLAASPTTVCTGGSVSLTASTAATNIQSYQFFSNGTAISPVQTSNMFTDMPTASTTYTVVATDSNGCQGTSPGSAVSVTTTPQVVLNASTLKPCIGSSFTLTATPKGFASYQFFANGISLGAPQSANTFVTSAPQTTTTYTVTATTSNCMGTSKPISVTTQPCANIIINKCCSKHIFANDTVSFTISLQNIGGVAATNVVVTDELPSCFTFKKASGTGWTFQRSGQEITAQFPLLGVGQKTSFTLIATACCCNVNPNVVENTATVVSDTSGPASSTATITIVQKSSCS